MLNSYVSAITLVTTVGKIPTNINIIFFKLFLISLMIFKISIMYINYIITRYIVLLNFHTDVVPTQLYRIDVRQVLQVRHDDTKTDGYDQTIWM